MPDRKSRKEGHQQQEMQAKDERNSKIGSIGDHDRIKEEEAPSVTKVEGIAAVPAPGPTVPYTVFTKAERRTITWLIRCSMFFSPFIANIYFPCLEELQRAMGVNSSLINLSTTTYLIIQAIAPAFCGDLADHLGRRPVYLLTFTIYACANLGLALQKNYAALMVLRGLQGFGCSATVAISYGVVADVATPATRGNILGPAMIATNLGPSIGPLVGGILASRAGWRWVFWVLVIVGAAFLAILAALFPETGRNVVGNGSLVAPKWNRPLLQLHKQHEQIAPVNEKVWRKRDLIPNPLKALLYAAYYCMQASMPAIFTDLYGLDELQVGLCYFSIGTGVIVGGYMNGKLMDWNYRVIARAHGITVDKVVGDDLAEFPIEKARSRMSWLLLPVSTVVIVGYGWVLQQRVLISALLVLLFLHGFLATCICQTHNTLIVDISPENPSTAAAAGNITRCVLSAAVVATMQPLLESIGRGWFFTALAMLSGILSATATLVIRLKGMTRRNETQSREREEAC